MTHGMTPFFKAQKQVKLKIIMVRNAYPSDFKKAIKRREGMITDK